MISAHDPTIATWRLIGPPDDHIYTLTGSFMVAAAAACLLGDGPYGLMEQTAQEPRFMPRLPPDPASIDDWFCATFSTPHSDVAAFVVEECPDALADCFRSVVAVRNHSRGNPLLESAQVLERAARKRVAS